MTCILSGVVRIYYFRLEANERYTALLSDMTTCVDGIGRLLSIENIYFLWKTCLDFATESLHTIPCKHDKGLNAELSIRICIDVYV